MTKIKLTPLPKIDLSKIEVNQRIEIHADRLASFKSNLSRFNSQFKDPKQKHKYIYSGVKNDYYTAMRSL